MKHAHLVHIVSALNLAAVRYLIVGGVAVNVHGYLRHTKDLDLVIAPEESNCRAAMDALTSLGYVPKRCRADACHRPPKPAADLSQRASI